MSHRTHCRPAFLAAALVTLLAARPSVAKTDAVWTSDLVDDSNAAFAADVYDAQLAGQYDADIQLAQAAAPAESDRPQTTRTASRAARTSRVPYMIGDQSIGLSGGLVVEGAEFAEFDHPIFGGNRLNVAENGSVLPTDRVFVTYRHFANAYESRILGQPNDTDVERFDVGFEKTALDGLVSAELRVPLLRQLNTDLDIYNDGSGDSSGPLSDRHGELGNLGVTFKLSLLNRTPFGLTAGVGVNCPTGDDARIIEAFDDPSIVITQTPLVTTVPPTAFGLEGRFNNETVNLVPYLAWYARPTSRFFHQGFLQIDAPLNRSSASIEVVGQITPDAIYNSPAFAVQQTGELDQQTLLRLNLGFGYWLTQGEGGGALRGLAALFECHYTSALDNANPFVLPVTQLDATTPGDDDVPVNVLAGPLYSNIDQVNLTAGLAADFGALQVTNGVVVPVTEDQNRSFDFEYSLQLNRRF